jgi:hypothetical protein
MQVYNAHKNILEPASYLQYACFPKDGFSNSDACCDAYDKDYFYCEKNDICDYSVSKNCIEGECSHQDDWEHVHYYMMNIE